MDTDTTFVILFILIGGGFIVVVMAIWYALERRKRRTAQLATESPAVAEAAQPPMEMEPVETSETVGVAISQDLLQRILDQQIEQTKRLTTISDIMKFWLLIGILGGILVACQALDLLGSL